MRPECLQRALATWFTAGLFFVVQGGVPSRAAGQESVTRAAEISFSRDILPILSDNCLQCHGPDAKSREADLRLDDEFSAKAARDPGGVIVPGNAPQSLLIQRITTANPDELMPPPSTKRTLTKAQIDLLSRWIAGGAPWGRHWAFESPRQPSIPPVQRADWPRNPIDAFVLARLEANGWQPSPEAGKEKLLRRLTLELTGLPPTVEELDAIIADSAPDALDRASDRLLASPRFGERMAWDWLDAARYADTNGYQGDPTRAMWYWRDWTIRAFNAGRPYDQFTVEQLAGDLLPQPTQEQLIASGFHRNHMINGEGGRIAEESRVEYVQDRVETTGTVWLGLTLTCARCHDHKYDPISQKEYYQLSAFFNSIEESGANDAGGLANPIVTLMSADDEKRLGELKNAEQLAKAERDRVEQQARAGQEAWEQNLSRERAAPATPQWTVLEPGMATSAHGAVLAPRADGAILVSGPNPPRDDLVVQTKLPVAGITALRLEVLPDPSLKNQGPGRASENGNFVLSEFKVQASGRTVEWATASADFEQNGWPIKNVLDNNDGTGWAILPEFGKPHTAVFVAKEPFPGPPGGDLVIRLEHRSPHLEHVLGCFRISVTTAPAESLVPLPDAVAKALAVAAEQRDAAQKTALAEYYLGRHAAYQAATRRLDGARQSREQFEKSLPRTMVMRERQQPRDTFVLVRGAYDKPGEKVERGTLSCLPTPPSEAAQDRLMLARWLVSPDNPLTSRVTVNRIWQQVFGTGLVKTTEDFGVQGERPSHPELLDWLALAFASRPSPTEPFAVEQLGWDLKALVRMMVSSAAYRQQSHVGSGWAERDPENRWLARGPRFRLPSWALRDQALALSGLLVDQVGGAPVRPYQPDGIWEEATFGKIRYTQDHGAALYRRSLYVFWRRIVGPTMFFDVANRQVCQVKVGRTNTPLHALVTLNDVTYVEAARCFAERLLREPGDDDQRLSRGFRLCTSRQPSERERSYLRDALARLRGVYSQDLAAAQKLIASGESKPAADLDAVELAAYTGIASLLLNLDETLTKE